MSFSRNTVSLYGHVGQDPATTTFANGGSVTKVSLATNETWLDKATGEQKESTQWHSLVIPNKLGTYVQNNVVKGNRLFVEGSINYRNWTDENGNTRYVTEIKVSSVINVDHKPISNSTPRTTPTERAYNGLDGADKTISNILDGELPF